MRACACVFLRVCACARVCTLYLSKGNNIEKKDRGCSRLLWLRGEFWGALLADGAADVLFTDFNAIYDDGVTSHTSNEKQVLK